MNDNIATTQTALAVMALQRFSNEDLAAFNLAINFPGYIPQYNRSYEAAVDASLVDKEGQPWDAEILRRAASFEVNQRIQKGVWL